MNELAVAHSTAGVVAVASFNVTARSVKLTPPSTIPSGGINTSATNDDTILPNAPPMTMPTARSTTLPAQRKFLEFRRK